MQHCMKESDLGPQFVFFYLSHHWTQSHTSHKRQRPNNRTTCDVCFSVRPLSILSLSVSCLARRCLDPRSSPDELTSPSVPKNSYSRKHTWPSPLPLCIGIRVFISPQPPPHSLLLPPSSVLDDDQPICLCVCVFVFTIALKEFV